MIISRTPYRISFFGGGTDYPAWYREHGGSVLGATINKYCYLTCRYLPPFFEHRTRIVYRNIENVMSVDDIAHPAVREVLRHFGFERGVEIHHDGDLPARSGVGSSSAFTVGLIHAIHALKGTIPTKQQLALESIHLEQDVLKENVGCQDQVLAAYGGFNHVTFAPDGDIRVRPMTLLPSRIEELNSNLMLFFTGLHRTASDVAASYTGSLQEKERPMNAIAAMVDEAIATLTHGRNLDDFGRLLHETWTAKQTLSDMVSNRQIGDIYAEARRAGALGGKIIGAGGGGYMLLFVPPPHQASVRERLRHLIRVPFKFEFGGSQIIFFDPEEDHSAHERAGACAQPALHAAVL
jgi:D-glycero-alpha-D-manno-heptose-7-phosphate kinase